MGKYVDSILVTDEQVIYETKRHWVSFNPFSIIEYFTSEFAITNMRLIVKVGGLFRKNIDIQLQQVETVDVDQSPFGRLLDFGTVTVVVTGGKKESLEYIPHPFEFCKKLQELL